jgi:hypothetical protein
MIYVAHDANLLGSFVKILLIDAYLIDPDSMSFIGGTKVSKCLKQVFRNREISFIARDMPYRCEVAPCVRYCLVGWLCR